MIVLGVIPGTKIETGFLLPLVLIAVVGFFLVKWAKQANQELMEFKTNLARQEKAHAKSQAVSHTNEPNNHVVDEDIEMISI